MICRFVKLTHRMDLWLVWLFVASGVVLFLVFVVFSPYLLSGLEVNSVSTCCFFIIEHSYCSCVANPLRWNMLLDEIQLCCGNSPGAVYHHNDELQHHGKHIQILWRRYSPCCKWGSLSTFLTLLACTRQSKRIESVQVQGRYLGTVSSSHAITMWPSVACWYHYWKYRSNFTCWDRETSEISSANGQ